VDLTFWKSSVWCTLSYYTLCDVTKHRTGCTGPKYRSWVLVKCVWCGAYYWFWLKKGTGYDFHAFLLALCYFCCLFSVRYRCIWGWCRQCGRCGWCGVLWHLTLWGYLQCGQLTSTILARLELTSYRRVIAAYTTVACSCALAAVTGYSRILEVDWPH